MPQDKIEPQSPVSAPKSDETAKTPPAGGSQSPMSDGKQLPGSSNTPR